MHLVAIGNTRRYDLFGPDFYRNISRVVAAADAITFADTLVEDELYVSTKSTQGTRDLNIHRL